MPKGDGQGNGLRRRKILVEPLEGVDYISRFSARLAWNAGAAFRRVGPDGDGRHITRQEACLVESRIGEVLIKFDKGRQGLVIRIPLPKQEKASQPSSDLG